MVSVQSHQYGLKNSHAQFKKEITVEKVLSSFMVASPLQLLDCCPFSDGAAALIIASEEVAKKLTDRFKGSFQAKPFPEGLNGQYTAKRNGVVSSQ